MPLIAEAVYVDPPAPGLGRRLMLATIAIFCAGVLLYLASLIIGYGVREGVHALGPPPGRPPPGGAPWTDG